MATVGSIGVGLLILIIVWITALAVFVFSVRYQNNNIGWIILGSAAVFTIILVSIPIKTEFEQNQILEIVEKDYQIIYKKILLTFIIGSAIVSFLAFFVIHCIEPIRIKPIKSFHLVP